jgi:2-polyprenyl-6-methoxyphenol hydroxylase-like FAD-dependent oxidoreductase
MWPAIEPHAEPILEILVSDGRARGRFSDGARSPFHLHFDSRELGEGEPLGWIVENRVLRDAIFEAIGHTPAVRLIAPARVTGVSFEPGAAHVALESGERRSSSAPTARNRCCAARLESVSAHGTMIRRGSSSPLRMSGRTRESRMNIFCRLGRSPFFR